MKYGFIYETTNLLNGKKYIGKHKRHQDPCDPDDSHYLGSGKYISRAIEKYGTENFSRKILCDCDTEEELREKERYYIGLYDAVNSPQYYNLVYDANPPVLHRGENPERDLQKSLLFKTRNPSYKPENKDKISHRLRVNNPMTNPDTLEKMRNSKVGVSLSEEHKERLSISHKGREFSETHRHNLSLSQKGKKLSVETKKKISDTVKSHCQDPGYMERVREARRSARYKKVCAICDKEFLGLSSRSKYCNACKEVRGH